MPGVIELPDGCELVRTTPEFDETSVPAGLLRNHRVAGGVWGRLVVLDGVLDFEFEGEPPRHLTAGDVQVIPPKQPHRVAPVGAVRFVVEFHRPPLPLPS